MADKVLGMCGSGAVEEEKQDGAKGQIVFVLTNDKTELGENHPTGWFLPEVAHPLKELEAKGFSVIFASPKGGVAPMDPTSAEGDFGKDETNKAFLEGPRFEETQKTVKYSDVDMAKIKGVFYPGGHGPMFDLAKDADTAKQTAAYYEAGGVVGAVCHGTAALIPIKLESGEALMKGKEVTSFSDVEEDMVKLTDKMPFALEQECIKQGATYKKAEAAWGVCVCSDNRVITGQNPASAGEVGKAFADCILACMEKAKAAA